MFLYLVTPILRKIKAFKAWPSKEKKSLGNFLAGSKEINDILFMF